ncbi:MAG: HD domain-containing protein [Candidatus Scalindua sp.]
MGKNIHEIRDPIHVFVRLDSHERAVLDSRPFQRLRQIHQLALTYLVYPGATHRRFEHSLGVMELASRLYDVITHPDNLTDQIKADLPEVSRDDDRSYWRRVIRMAALCHDIGHLPFSHAAEKELLPKGWDHERITREIILSDEMKTIWGKITPPFRPEDIVKLAIGPKKAKDLDFSPLETILAEIIVGDAFGIDRMDYLLRDSHHIGVAYGKFDHYRLIDTMRILHPAPSDQKETSNEPALGVEEGGIQSAEALMLARYFMYSQVYFHAIRRIYDIHLKDFLKGWLKDDTFSTDINEYLAMTDNEVITELLKAANDTDNPYHNLACRIVCHEHFKELYRRNPNDVNINPEAGQAIYKAAQKEFGPDKFRHDRYTQKSGAPEFPVKTNDDKIVSSLAISTTLCNLPVISIDYVFADRDILEKAFNWLEKNRYNIIQLKEEEEDNE